MSFTTATAALLLAVAALAPTERPEAAHGLPPGLRLERPSYVAIYDGRARVPALVAEYLTPDRLEGSARRDGLGFRSDPTVPAEFRPTLAAYNGSGFDFGHLAAAANHKRSFDDLAATFLVSNAAPQAHDFNAGAWLALENHARDLAAAHGETWIYSGPAYWAEPGQTLTIDRLGEIWVPTHFFKVLVSRDRGQLAARAWLLPANAKSTVPLERFAVPIDLIERAAGLDLLDRLNPDLEATLEREAHP
ncbi:MAG: DNA/RNA non-specific endonuclease [Pirellulales bacterium]|nr:DNA/RNA non-specific endonuclease [Pirellulales bacterium]